MSLYDSLAKNEVCVKLVNGAKKKKNDVEKKRRVKGNYKFIDRSRYWVIFLVYNGNRY